MELRGRGAVERVFAGELTRSMVAITRGDPPQQGVLSPTGACLRQIVLVGVLTEVIRRGEEVQRARLSDPTGTVELSLRPHNLPPADALLALTPPAFLAVTGTVRLQGGRVVIEPDTLTPVGRAERDVGILVAAERTIGRMEALREDPERGSVPEATRALRAAYPAWDQDLAELKALVRTALDTVPAETAPAADAEAVVREILSTHPGVLEIAWLLEKAGDQGVRSEDARRCVQMLLAEGECYSPRNGYLRLL